MSGGLPPGWAAVCLGDVSEVVMGQAPRGTDCNTSGLGTVFVKAGEFAQESPLVREWTVRPLKLARRGDVLICVVGATCGKLNLGIDCAIGRSVAALRPSTAIETRLLYRQLQPMVLSLRAGAVGSAQGVIARADLEEVPLRIPPLPEQRRIVAKLEKLLGKVDACKERLAKIPVLLKRFRQAVLAAACSGRLTEDWRRQAECSEDAEALLHRMRLERAERWRTEGGKGKYRMPKPVQEHDLPAIPEAWRWTNFDHCAWEITVGHVGPMKDRYATNGVAFLRSQNVRPFRLDHRGLVHIPSGFHHRLGKSQLRGGEILVVRSGANTGDCCSFPADFGPANCADLVITRPLSGLRAEYGALYINSPTGRALLTLSQTGIAQPHFNIGAMRVKAFPLPPLAEQKEIVRRVHALFAVADQIQARFERARQQVEKLTPSLLARAFRGDLVPQDPNDEPASALLERITKERHR